MSSIEREYPYTGFNFVVQNRDSNLVLGGFSEVTGLEINTEFEEYKEGGKNDFAHKLPTITKYQNLVLKRGMTTSNLLYDWEKEVASGRINPKNISIILLDSQGNEVKRWDFKEAFPVKWSCGNLNSTSSSIEIETVELAHQGLLL